MDLTIRKLVPERPSPWSVHQIKWDLQMLLRKDCEKHDLYHRKKSKASNQKIDAEYYTARKHRM